jgi:hypothetical protein
MVLKFVNFYLVKASINSAFFKEVYPEIPCSLAKAFNSATVIALISLDAVSAFGASAFVSAFLGAAFLAPEVAIDSI